MKRMKREYELVESEVTKDFDEENNSFRYEKAIYSETKMMSVAN